MSHIEEKQEVQEPIRMQYAKEQLIRLGYEVTQIGLHALRFTFKGQPVTIYPYSGWFTGKTVKDGRGIERLIKQVKQQSNQS